MEDVILSIYPYCNNEDMGLFAIFDGHGGNSIFIQDPNALNMLENISPTF